MDIAHLRSVSCTGWPDHITANAFQFPTASCGPLPPASPHLLRRCETSMVKWRVVVPELFVAMMATGYRTQLPTAEVPAMTAVPFPLSVKDRPRGSGPDSVRTGEPGIPWPGRSGAEECLPWP